jgi:hypothetical protein
MKFFIILIVLNLFVFWGWGLVGVITSLLTILFIRATASRGAMPAKAYAFLDGLNSGLTVDEANHLVRNMSLERIAMLNQPAMELVRVSYNGSQLNFINKAISSGMTEVGWIDKQWLKYAGGRKKDKTSLIAENKPALDAYKQKFVAFRDGTLNELDKLGKASDFVMDDTDRTVLMRYLVEANEAAMEQFGIHINLQRDLNILVISNFGIPHSQARGLLAALKTPSPRDPETNEKLDTIEGAGYLAYRDWIDIGDEALRSRTEKLWKGFRELHELDKFANNS